jgi:hypothetical protein
MQWLQDPNKNNADTLNNLSPETSRHFRNKNKYLKAKIEENEKLTVRLETCIGETLTLRRDTSLELLRDEKNDLVADSHSILARWRSHFSQLLNVIGVNDVRHTEIHTAEPLLDETIACELDMAIEKLKRHKSPGIDQIPAELIKAGVRKIYCEVHKLIISIWTKEELPAECKKSIILTYL